MVIVNISEQNSSVWWKQAGSALNWSPTCTDASVSFEWKALQNEKKKATYYEITQTILIIDDNLRGEQPLKYSSVMSLSNTNIHTKRDTHNQVTYIL